MGHQDVAFAENHLCHLDHGSFGCPGIVVDVDLEVVLGVPSVSGLVHAMIQI